MTGARVAGVVRAAGGALAEHARAFVTRAGESMCVEEGRERMLVACATSVK